MSQLNPKVMEKINNGRQYRDMKIDVEVRSAGEPDEGSFLVRGYATTFNEPYLLYSGDDYEVWEEVDKDSFNECDMSDVIMQYDHEGRVFARTSNDTLKITIDEHGLLIEADLGGTEIGRQLYEEIKGGYTNKMSFGFTVVSDETRTIHEDGMKTKYLRTITKVGKLYDVSSVSIPANSGTEISARAFIDGVIAKVEAERLLIAEERKAKAEELERRIKVLTLEVRLNES